MAEGSIVKFPDVLRVRGVMAKGYGIICKFPMTDPELGVYAKAIYALICSYSGNGTTACPSRDKIMDLLSIGRKAYAAGVKQLQDQGYMSIQKHNIESNGRFSHNIYTIETNPKKFKDTEYTSSGGTLTSSLKYADMKQAGFGLLPRTVMIDQRLTPIAKIIYAYLASFAGAGSVAFPEAKNMQYHLGIGRTAYFTHMRKLIETNYITSVQRHVNGRLGVSDYVLNDNPDPEAVQPYVERRKKKRVIASGEEERQSAAKEHSVQSAAKEHAVKERSVEETLAREHTGKETVVKETTVRETTIINNIPINSSPNISPSINSSVEHWMDGWSREEVIDYLEIQNEPYQLRDAWKLDLIDSEIRYIIEIIADFICSGQQNIRIRGVLHERKEVIDKLIGLTADQYVYVKNKINTINGKITNMRTYYLVCLYFSKEDQQAEIAREIAQDSANF